MNDVKQKLKELEDQVSSIKDPALKKVAFEKLLESALTPNKPTASKQKIVSSPKSKKRKSKGSQNIFYSDVQVREEVRNMNVTGSLKEYPKFRSCSSKMDCYLWILAYAKEHGIDGLNIHEIAFVLSKKLFKPTKYSTVYGIHKKVREGIVIKEPGTENWRITPDGEEYLQTLTGEKNV